MSVPEDELVFTSSKCGVSFRVKVSPGARRERVMGIHAGALKVSVQAAPEKGKANVAVRKLLSRWLEVAPAQIEITHGQTQPLKQVRVSQLPAETLRRRVADLIAPSGGGKN